MKTIRLNNVKVKPLITIDTSKGVLGEAYIPQAYSNTFLISKKRSGKTTIISELLMKCSSKRTKIVIFSSTCNKDKSYKLIKKRLEERGNDVICFESFLDGKENILENILDEIEIIDSEDEDEDEEGEDEPVGVRFTPPRKKRKKKKKKKPKKLEPKITFVFDDMSTLLRHKSISSLLKKNRHFQANVIVATQALTDLLPEARKQADFVLTFKSFNETKLQALHSDLDLSVEFDKFLQMYDWATEKQYSFFYIDVRNDKYRRNFDTQIMP